MLQPTVIFSVFAFLYGGVASQMCACPDGWVYFERSCYFFNDELNIDWTEATHHCSALNAKLVEIDNNNEDAFLQTYSKKLFKCQSDQDYSIAFWVGATDEVTEGIWQYTSGEHLSYTNWAPGQPDTHHGNNEDCLYLYGHEHFQWHDGPCSIKSHYICEIRLAQSEIIGR